MNEQRLLRMLEELARIGAIGDGGVCRLAFSGDDLRGRNYVQQKLEEGGLEVRIDAVGNLFGVLPGQSTQPAVMIGSHTDTVASGGRYDGALGVLAAVEVALSLVENGIVPQRPLVVASFVNEEGARFMPDMMGSLYYCDRVSLQDVASAQDSDGVTISEEWNRLGYTGDGSIQDLRPATFLELHIEQGIVLADGGHDVGVVTGVQGLSWFNVEVKGSGNHAGTTPMERRRDAGAAATHLMQQIRSLVGDVPGLRVTIGSVRFIPNLVNVIPSGASFSVDLRHPDPQALVLAEERVQALLARDNSPCRVSWTSTARVAPISFADAVVDAVRKATVHLGLNGHEMISGAGHDAQILASSMEAGMIFVPSKNGISHDPTEYTAPEHCIAGANVLLGATLDLLER